MSDSDGTLRAELKNEEMIFVMTKKKTDWKRSYSYTCQTQLANARFSTQNTYLAYQITSNGQNLFEKTAIVNVQH